MPEAQSTPDCLKQEVKVITGPCPKCGAEMEFFTVSELRNQKSCQTCKAPFDAKAFADEQGLSI
ncbi:MAG: hypothetical protein LBP92_03870 [Deltaproteobacteria bacterium]|jgi:uncharacterized CHY-type Zn-finger protein|nr:hypothetical protein [Deltaproteobacteria bacterium]